jgi:hypothetical protein
MAWEAAMWFLFAAAGFPKTSLSAMAPIKAISSTMPKPLTYLQKLPDFCLNRGLHGFRGLCHGLLPLPPEGHLMKSLRSHPGRKESCPYWPKIVLKSFHKSKSVTCAAFKTAIAINACQSSRLFWEIKADHPAERKFKTFFYQKA